MRLVELFIQEQRPTRNLSVDLWIDYEAHNGNLRPNEFSKRSEWLEESLKEVAEHNRFGETGSGGWIGAAGGSRDISFTLDSESMGSSNINDMINNTLSCASRLDELQSEIKNTISKLGLNSMSIDFDYSFKLNLEYDEELLTLGNLEDIKKLKNGTITIEQLIDAASHDINESKSEKKFVVKTSQPRNFVAKNAKTSGSGTHGSSDAEKIKQGKFRKLKHKNKDIDE